MKKITFLLLIISFVSFAQREKTTKTGLTTVKELQIPVYEKDVTANAIVLYEHANIFSDDRNNFDLRKDYYFRIKLFKKEAFDKGTFTIPLYKKERTEDIKAITYTITKDGSTKATKLLKENIFTKQTSENWKEVTFTLPNLTEGCVIEIVYSIISPYFKLDSWYFQSDIPKLKSEYDSAILGNWKYKARINGYLKLDKDKPSVKHGCTYMPGIGSSSCSVYSYQMNNIPAFKEEDYMLSKENFISKISFDLISFASFRTGKKTKYTKTWKNVDRFFKKNYFDGQTSKKSFFKKKLPTAILEEQNNLSKAKKVYVFIKNRFTWNGRFWNNKRLNIKDVYKEKSGSVSAINLSLYNSLQAVEIESYLVMLSTRENGLPTKLFPVTSDFNYLIVKAIIDGENYFLDATNRNAPFGLLPFRCLNGEGRVLDFKNGSYWEKLTSTAQTLVKTNLLLTLKEDAFVGRLSVIRKGYDALRKRNEFDTTNKESYLEDFESKYVSIEVDTYKNSNRKELQKPLREDFEITIDTDVESGNILRINPFFIDKINENPFKLNERDFPVDFGYKRTKIYVLRLKIPEEYIIKKLPPKKGVRLPDNGASFTFNTNKKDNIINLIFRYKINKVAFSNEEYFYLKEFYTKLIESQNSYIELERK